MRSLFGVFALIILFSCAVKTKNVVEPDKQSVLDKSIALHFDTQAPHFAFNFRNRDYTVKYSPDSFEYTCIYSDSLGVFKRVLNNQGYTEYLNEEEVSLTRKDSLSHSESVNSVAYFNLLPLVLKEPAAKTKISGQESLDGKAYHKLEVRFQEEGGGTDFQDVFYYWIDTTDCSVDYLAYSYLTDGGGTRFRKAVNQRKINGIVFQDYLNYKGPASPDSLPYIKDLYVNDNLKLLSKIEIDAIRVMN